MLNEKVRELLNQQINKELYSAYLYLDFSNYFEDRGLNGFANWYMIQAQEERDH
ncbi:MAG: ferritin-like domain-containing protein, partial [Clostridia bacterium]|nr:ferritin-like domain-containing protein [Clostridia bacterium]